MATKDEIPIVNRADVDTEDEPKKPEPPKPTPPQPTPPAEPTGDPTGPGK